jgi:hypothetical protein
MPRRSIVLLTLVCLFVSAGRAAHAAPRYQALGGKDLKKAESILSKLRRLEETTASGDSDSFDRAAGRLYPGIFAKVSGLRDGDLKTDLATAVSLYESAFRIRREGGGPPPDCSRELRDSYSRLCRETPGGDPVRLLRAKARLHASWAEMELRYARGDRDAETLDAMSLIRAERGTDLALAEEALHVLKELAEGISTGASALSDSASASGIRVSALNDGMSALSTGASALRVAPSTLVVAASALGVGESSARAPARHTPPREQAGRLSENLSGSLEEIDRILASLPRSRAHQLLHNARDAFRDGLYWRLESLPARALIVSANSFDAPDTLPQTGLRADDADRAELANLRSAFKFIARAEEALQKMNAESVLGAGF